MKKLFTILALFGQPVPRSWPGRALGGVLEDAFLERYPVRYRNDGYLLSQVIVPAQTVEDGFVRLQAVHDKGDLETLGDFVTPELFRDIAAQLEHGAGRQQTEVVTLTADVIGVATEGNHHVVSVRFAGLIREAPQEAAAPFSEVWHLEKPVDGSSGWLVSGIQQDEPEEPAPRG